MNSLQSYYRALLASVRGVGGEVLWRSADPVYTTISNRRDANVGVLVSVEQATGPISLVINIEHKNVVDETWKNGATFNTITAAGEQKAVVENVLELVRLKFTLSAGGPGSAWLRVADPEFLWYG